MLLHVIANIDCLINLGLTPFQQFFSHITTTSLPTHVFSWIPHNSTSHQLSKQLAVFLHKLLAQCWNTNGACHSDFCKTSERKLAELGFELTTPGLSALIATEVSYRVSSLVTSHNDNYVNASFRYNMCCLFPSMIRNSEYAGSDATGLCNELKCNYLALNKPIPNLSPAYAITK